VNDHKRLAEFCNQINRQRRPSRSFDTSSFWSFLIGALCILVGLGIIGLGIYIGIVPMLVGGIVQIIEGAKLNPVDATMVGWGIAKAVFFELPIVVGFWLGIFSIGCAFIRR
jgi:hypothetical protein